MCYGKTPFADLTLFQKLRCIADPRYTIAFPPLRNLDLMRVLQECLQRDPAKRPAIAGPEGLLSSPFLRPYAALSAGRGLAAPLVASRTANVPAAGAAAAAKAAPLLAPTSADGAVYGARRA